MLTGAYSEKQLKIKIITLTGKIQRNKIDFVKNEQRQNIHPLF